MHFFDTANMCTQGSSEKMLGRALKGLHSLVRAPNPPGTCGRWGGPPWSRAGVRKLRVPVCF